VQPPAAVGDVVGDAAAFVLVLVVLVEALLQLLMHQTPLFSRT
jgi:hypothetical protein